MKRTKVVEKYDGKDYTLATITSITAKQIPLSQPDGSSFTGNEFSDRLIAASLISGGFEGNADEAIAFVDDIPIMLDGWYNEFLDAATEVNGLSVTKPSADGATGEGQAVEEQAK